MNAKDSQLEHVYSNRSEGWKQNDTIRCRQDPRKPELHNLGGAGRITSNQLLTVDGH